jgi:hypothetical protein
MYKGKNHPTLTRTASSVPISKKQNGTGSGFWNWFQNQILNIFFGRTGFPIPFMWPITTEIIEKRKADWSLTCG